MIENLYEAARDRIESELNDGDGSYCDISAIEYETDYIAKLNLLSDKLDEFEQGDIDYVDLKEFTKFIKRDERGSESFREELEAMFEFDNIENIDENIESIVSIVF